MIHQSNATPMDAMKAHGGEGAGPSPKELVLQGLAGCTAMDVVSILTKMRTPPESFRVEVSAGMTDTHPKVFTAIHLRYVVTGAVPRQNVDKAVRLSQDQYCGVSAMLKKAAPLTFEIACE